MQKYNPAIDVTSLYEIIIYIQIINYRTGSAHLQGTEISSFAQKVGLLHTNPNSLCNWNFGSEHILTIKVGFFWNI
jgi:hypothetical protein